MDWQQYADQVTSEWYALLGSDPEESDVHQFLALHPALIPGGSGDIGPGGHHGSEMSAVYSEPTLSGAGGDLRPDFMWVTRSSGLITPILIEIEKPSKPWFKKNGRPTAQFTEAHDQLNDWRAWFARDGNPSLFRQQYMLTDQFLDRPLEPQFVLIYGRSSEFDFGVRHTDPQSLRHKRDSQRRSGETFQTFDSLRPRYDHRVSLTAKMTAKGPSVYAFSPLYATGATTGPDAVLLGDASDAFRRSVMMSDERRDYLEQRWNYWASRQMTADAKRPTSYSMGLE